MKILILAPENRRRVKLARWLHRHDTFVVGMGNYRGIHIMEEIARSTPNVVIFAEEQIDADTEAVLAFVAEKFQSLVLIRLPMLPGDRDVPLAWGDILLKVLKAPLPSIVPQPYAAETRLVFHDPQFQQFAKIGKLTRGSLPDDHQVAKLFLLLDGGITNHHRAQNYLNAVEATLPGINAELCYRMVHESYKGLSWGRDLIAKFIAVIVHYIPGVEIDYLPHPSPIHSSVDYVHYFQAHEGHYALSALMQLRINPSLSELLISTSQWLFNGQGGVTLAAEQCQLFGIAAMLHRIARAHTAVMDRWLTPNSVNPEIPLSREAHRDEGIVRDFWDWGSPFEERSKLAGLLKAYHHKTWRPDFVFPSIPTFADFVDKYSSGRNE